MTSLRSGVKLGLMNKSLNIKYQGETYRDDRIFVMNLSHGKVEKNSETYAKFILVTFRNSIKLVATKQHYFDNKEGAEKYIKQVEHETPLISQKGKPLPIPENADKWEFWLNWLKEKKFHSAISGYQNLPYYENSDGGEFGKDNYVTAIITEDNKTIIMEDTTKKQ